MTHYTFINNYISYALFISGTSMKLLSVIVFLLFLDIINQAAAINLTWPCAEEFRILGRQLKGDVYLPGTNKYKTYSNMLDTLYHGDFAAIVFPESQGKVTIIL